MTLDDLVRPKMRQSTLAEVLGVSKQAVSGYASGSKRPDLPRVLALQTLYGVDPLSLLDDSERAEYEAILARGAALKEAP